MTTVVGPNEQVLTEGELAQKLREAAVPKDADGNVIVDQVFIMDNGESVSQDELVSKMLKACMSVFDQSLVVSEAQAAIEGIANISKGFVEGSTQSQFEFGESTLSTVEVVTPPYPPELMAKFLEVDETHFRACRAKTMDAVGRGWSLEPATRDDGGDLDPSDQTEAVKKQIDAEKLRVKEFIEDANQYCHFEGVLESAAMDNESIGWAAIEVVRSRDMRIRGIAHVPASRVRVLRSWKGFVEITGPQKKVYYQPFGNKVVNMDGDPYNPRKDGDLSPSNNKIRWAMIDKNTGSPTSDFMKSANELLWVPRTHPNTIYYGKTDVLPALGHLLTNVNIRDFMLQFFEHNTVPQYAIVIEGAKMSPDVQEAISKYFSSEVKGNAHKTLIIPVPSIGGEVRVRFERLSSESREGSFQETRKNGAQGIMVAHGTPPAILGIAEAANLGSGKGLSQAEIYKDRIVTPSQIKWARTINRLLRLGLGVKMLSINFDPLDIRDYEAEMKVHTGYLEKGCLTINQLREMVGIGDPIEGGDRAFILSGQGILFVDELTTASSADKQEMQDEIDRLTMKNSIKAANANPQRNGNATSSTPRR